MKSRDEKLIELALAGDGEAFGRLVRIYQNAVYATAFRLIGNFADAQDIAQEVFIEAYNKLYQLRSTDRFAGWLRSITINTCKMWMRSHKRQPDFKDAVICFGSEGAPDEAGLYEKLMSDLALLPEEQRMVIVLRYIDDLSYEQIGSFLGIPVGTVRSRLHRAKEKLKRRIVMIEEALDKVKLDPGFPEEVKRTISELEEVIQNEGRKLEANPNSSESHFELGCCYASLHGIILRRSLKDERVLAERAIRHLEKAVELGGGSAGAYLKMAEVYSDMGEAEDVRKMIDEVKCFSNLEEEAEWIASILWAQLGLAMICMGKSMYAEAEARIKIALELSPESAEAYALMSRAYAGKGDAAQSMACLKKALELSEANKDVAPKLHWVFPENSVDWSFEQVVDFAKTRKEFDGIKKDPQFQALLQI